MIQLDLYKGVQRPFLDFREWGAGCWVRISGLAIREGHLANGDSWMLVGSFLGGGEFAEVVERVRAGSLEDLFKGDGQFVLLIRSSKDGTIDLYRDRTGVLPIMYGHGPKGFAISIWPKNVIKLSGIQAKACGALLQQFPLYRITIPPESTMDEVKGLSGRHSLRVSDNHIDIIDHPISVLNGSRYISLPIAASDLGECLSVAVKKRIAGSRSIGAWLSGGTDSSLLVALAREQYAGDIRTIFVTFEDYDRNYGKYARDVARRYDCNHTEVVVDAIEYADSWAETIATTQEPINSPATIGQWLALKRSALSVDAMLIGEGADTVFGGPYWAPMLWLSFAGGGLPPFLRNILREVSGKVRGESFLSHGVSKGLRALGTPIKDYLHSEIAFGDPDAVDCVFGAGTWRKTIVDLQGRVPPPVLHNLIVYLLLDWLPNYNAALKRIGFHYGLMYVLPFVDYKLIQRSLQLPMSLRYHYLTKKASLKKYALRYFDKDFISKPKEGFGVPLGRWLVRKEFAPFLGLPLEERSLKRGWWNERELRKSIEVHRNGHGTDNSAESVPWIAMNLELWARIVLEGDSPALYRMR